MGLEGRSDRREEEGEDGVRETLVVGGVPLFKHTPVVSSLSLSVSSALRADIDGVHSKNRLRLFTATFFSLSSLPSPLSPDSHPPVSPSISPS